MGCRDAKEAILQDRCCHPIKHQEGGSPSLSKMREWIDAIVNQPSKDFFIRNSNQDRSFSDLKKASIAGCSSKAARYLP